MGNKFVSTDKEWRQRKIRRYTRRGKNDDDLRRLRKRNGSDERKSPSGTGRVFFLNEGISAFISLCTSLAIVEKSRIERRTPETMISKHEAGSTGMAVISVKREEVKAR